jgi:transglutaminase-like putative cysteine protease
MIFAPRAFLFRPVAFSRWDPRVRLRLVVAALLLLSPLGAQETLRFRTWIAGQEAGSSQTIRREAPLAAIETREELRLERQGMEIRQTVEQTATRNARGDEHYTWRVVLSALPMTGEAVRLASAPRKLVVTPAGSPARTVDIPEGALVWPGDLEARLREAARTRSRVSLRSYSFPLQQWSETDLVPAGPAPLPGFPGAVKFTGRVREGAMESPVESWITPTEGEIRQVSTLAGLPIVNQRAELPPPPGRPGGQGFFAQTVQNLPDHPLGAWLGEAVLRWSGAEAPPVAEDPQQHLLDLRRLRLREAAPPTAREAAQPPLRGEPSGVDRPFLAPTPLLQFQDTCFDGLLARLDPPKGASRWELARRVTRFVFEWISRKDYSVGFASALEVCRTPAGDCTEHGVLAVALLRRLGVPARGALGWVALDGTLGLHFWVEVALEGRWVPVDPTFNQAPASALRIKLGTTDLADLGSIGWDSAAGAFTRGQWKPEGPWARALVISGDGVTGPALPRLRLEGATWKLTQGRLEATFQGAPLQVRAIACPTEAQLQGHRLLQGARARGWYGAGTLLVALPGEHWLSLRGMDEATALRVLERVSLD